MRILFDHQIFSRQKFGGISRYFANIFHTIENSDNINADISTLHTNNYYIRNNPGILNNWIGDILFKKKSRNYKWNKQYSKYLVSKNNFDVFHPTYFHPYFLKYLKKPLVITVHDMTYEALPHFFSPNDPLPYQKRLLMNRADKIIAISETTKADILKYSDIKEEKIEVIHHGIDLISPITNEIIDLPAEYILFVGDRQGYKNFPLVAKAFEILSAKNPNLKLVLAGGGPIVYGDSELLLRGGITKNTIQISATDDQLNTIYRNALCFVYPSLYEGFGLPILEAFKNNCPVLLSKCSCFEEIAGSAANYFDAYSVESLVSELTMIIESSSVRRQMIELGNAKLQVYPIEKCITKTIDLYRTFGTTL